MNELADIREYNESSYEISLPGIRRFCPLYNTGENIWIVGNEHLCFGTDIEFTNQTGKVLAEMLSKVQAEIVLTAEAKPLAVAYELSKNLGHNYFAVARKNIKPYSSIFLSSQIHSITSAKEETLYIDEININRIQNKKVILFDDIISTGSTMKGLLDLAKKAGAKVAAIASIWLEGPWPFELFIEEFKAGRLLYIGILPIFARGEVYNKLYKKKLHIEKIVSNLKDEERISRGF